jgi:hypothetical protein
MVEGYTDASGRAEVNQRLSEKRARAVERYLQRSGVDEDRVETYGRGEALATDQADAADARVVVVRRCEQPAAGHTETPGAAPSTPSVTPSTPPSVTPEPPPATPPVEQPAPAEPTPVPQAQTAPPEEAPPPPPPVVTEPAPAPAPISDISAAPTPMGPAPLQSRIGVTVSAGGGLSGFVDKETRDVTDTGGGWDARVGIGTRLPIGLELAYTGSAGRISAPGLDPDAFLVGNGAEADLRFGLPFRYVRPYFFGGVGWTHYGIVNSSTVGSPVRDRDDVGLIPFGAGLSVGDQGGVQFDLRGTGRAVFANDNLLSGLYAGTGKEARLHSWGVTARLGWEF